MKNRRWLLLPGLAALLALAPSCVRMTHQLEQTKPLEINVNVRLQIDRELDEFFAFQNRTADPSAAPAPTAPPVPVPATQPAVEVPPGTQ